MDGAIIGRQLIAWGFIDCGGDIWQRKTEQTNIIVKHTLTGSTSHVEVWDGNHDKDVCYARYAIQGDFSLNVGVLKNAIAKAEKVQTRKICPLCGHDDTALVMPKIYWCNKCGRSFSSDASAKSCSRSWVSKKMREAFTFDPRPTKPL